MIKLFAFILLLGVYTHSWADTALPATTDAARLKATMAGLRIPIHLETNHTGFLVQLHQWIMAEAKIDAQLQVMPSARAMALLDGGQIDGIFPSWVPDKYNSHVIFSLPFMKVNHYIYGKHGEKPFTSLTQLSNRRLGLIQNYQLNIDFSAYDNLYISYATNSQSLITLLLSGRVDAIILSDVEAGALEAAMSIEPLSVDPDAVLLTKELGYTFLESDQGRQLQRRVNSAIEKALATGMVDHYLQAAVRQLQ